MIRKIAVILALILIPALSFAETWRVTWGSCAATTQACAPSSYYNSDKGASTMGIPIAGKSSVQATCFTVGSGATDTDFNFLYDSQTANAHELCSSVGEASNCSWGIEVGGDFLKFTADNDDTDTADAVTPYCDVITW